MARLERGLVQVYTGNAKGKSTAGFGLAVRAIGQGLKVHIVQFMKTGTYGENNTFARLAPDVQVRAFGRKGFIHRSGARPEDYALAGEALSYAERVMLEEDVDLLILDEINNALYFELLTWDQVREFIDKKPQHVELVMTGRNAPAAMIELADLVTEMREVKHPYQQGIASRRGIEY